MPLDLADLTAPARTALVLQEIQVMHIQKHKNSIRQIIGMTSRINH
jgi:hypothetical protein